MSGHCYVYPLRSPPDHISILSSTYNDNLKEFIANGNIQTLIADNRDVARIFSQNIPLREMLVELHAHWSIGTLPRGLSPKDSRSIQLKRLKAFQYVYNLATANDSPDHFNRWYHSPRIDSVYYLDAIPRMYNDNTERYSPCQVIINQRSYQYCTDIITKYPYLRDSVIPEINGNWSLDSRMQYLGDNISGVALNQLTEGMMERFTVPMINLNYREIIGGQTFTGMYSFTDTWERVTGNMLLKLQHYYIQKAFGVDIRKDPIPIKPHETSKTESVRFRYFEYVTEFQNERTPERLKERHIQSQSQTPTEDDVEQPDGIPELSDIPGDIYYRMEYVTVNTTDSWLTVYNQLDEFNLESSAPRDNLFAFIGSEGDGDGDGDGDDSASTTPVSPQLIQSPIASGNYTARRLTFEDLSDDSGDTTSTYNFSIQITLPDGHVLPETLDVRVNSIAELTQFLHGMLSDSNVEVGEDVTFTWFDSEDFQVWCNLGNDLANLPTSPNILQIRVESSNISESSSPNRAIGGASESPGAPTSGSNQQARQGIINQFLTPHATEEGNSYIKPYKPLGNFPARNVPMYDILQIPEGTRLKYISYWEEYDVVLCYCETQNSIPIRNLRNIPDVLEQLEEASDTSDIPTTLQPETGRPFYVYLPRRAVSCQVLDVNSQNMVSLSLADPTWGTTNFYTKYVLRPSCSDYTSITNGGNLVTPNGKCNSVGWNLQDIKRAIQFSGITLNNSTFQHTHTSLEVYTRTLNNARLEIYQQYPSVILTSSASHRVNAGVPPKIYYLLQSVDNLWRKLRRQHRKYREGVHLTSQYTGQTLPFNYTTELFGLFSVSAPFTPEIQTMLIHPNYYHNVLPQSQLVTPSRSQMTTYWERDPNSKYFDFNTSGIPQLNLILTMVADSLLNNSIMATRIQNLARSQLPSSQPQNEWQRLCGRIRLSDADATRLREIIIQRSQRNSDPNRHLTMDGLAGLGKRRLCRLVVMQEMRDDRVKVQGIRKLVERHRARQEQLSDRYPEPPGVCTNFDAPMDVVVDQISATIDKLCLIKGKCEAIHQFFLRYQDTTYRVFNNKVQLTVRLGNLVQRQQSSEHPGNYQVDIDQVTEQLGDFLEEFHTFRDNVQTVFNSEIYNESIYVSPITMMCNMFIHPPANMFSLYSYSLALSGNTTEPSWVTEQLPRPRPDPYSSRREPWGEVWRREISASQDNWARDMDLTYREWEDHYRSVNWEGLFNRPLHMFTERVLNRSIRDYTKYLNQDNPNYDGTEINGITDIQEICDNYSRDAPTYRVASDNDYFVLVRSDFQSRCIHRSALVNAINRDQYLCEWVAPHNHPDALTDPNFDTGMYHNTTNHTIAVLSPRFPERKFYPIPLSETSQGVDTAYFDESDFNQIRREVEANSGSVHVFYLGDGTSVRMGNCGGDFGASQTHGQRDVAFQYRIRYHREITRDRIEFLTTQPEEQGVNETVELTELRERLTLTDAQIRAAAMSGDRRVLRRLQWEKRYLKRKIEWLEMGPDRDITPDDRGRFCTQLQQEYDSIQQQIDNLEVGAQLDTEEQREELRQTVRDEWDTLIGEVNCS
jgi:hypothetical protein